VPKRDLMELSGPIKRMAPKGLILARPGKQTPIESSNSIECGKCHMEIYRADDGFNANEFQEAKRKHYSNFPACEKQE